MRSAVFLPMPGIAGEPRDVGALHRGHELARLDAREHRDRQLRTDAADGDQPLEELLLELGEKSVELQRVLAHVRVHAQRDLRPLVADVVVGGERHVHVVADALHVDDDPVRLLVEHAPAKERDHPWAGGRYWRQVRGLADRRFGAGSGDPRIRGCRHRRPDGGIECRWQIATASASAASCGDGGFGRPSSSLIICCTWCFSARP